MSCNIVSFPASWPVGTSAQILQLTSIEADDWALQLFTNQVLTSCDMHEQFLWGTEVVWEEQWYTKAICAAIVPYPLTFGQDWLNLTVLFLHWWLPLHNFSSTSSNYALGHIIFPAHWKCKPWLGGWSIHLKIWFEFLCQLCTLQLWTSIWGELLWIWK